MYIVVVKTFIEELQYIVSSYMVTLRIYIVSCMLEIMLLWSFV